MIIEMKLTKEDFLGSCSGSYSDDSFSTNHLKTCSKTLSVSVLNTLILYSFNLGDSISHAVFNESEYISIFLLQKKSLSAPSAQASFYWVYAVF